MTASLAAEDEALLAPGTVLADRYRVDRVLGTGGMGAVYLAEHVHMRKQFAVKVLHKAMCANAEVVSRFEREAIAAGSIEHPNIAAATDFGRLADGAFFLVLEYVAGESLRALLDRGAIDQARAARITSGILGAIGAAHAKSIVHRDLKPENVMLQDRDGEPDFVKVLDFGIAKLEPQSAPGKVLTQMGAVFGTPDYMAPEQALGETVDQRADLYAVGVMLYEMLAGTRPFQGGAVTILTQRVVRDAPPLPEALAPSIDPTLIAVMQKLLAKMPDERFATAADAQAALAGAFRSSVVSSPESRARVTHPSSISGVASGPVALMPTMIASTSTRSTSLAGVRLPAITPARIVAAAAALGVLGTLFFALVLHGTSCTSSIVSPAVSSVANASAVANANASAAANAANDEAFDRMPPGEPLSRRGEELTIKERRAGVLDVPDAPAARGGASSSGGGGRNSGGGGGFHIPPPSQWFR